MKKILATLASVMLAGTVLAAPLPATEAKAAETKSMDIYILAGQSNAVGFSQLDQAVKGQGDSSYTYRKYLKEQDSRNVSGYTSVMHYGATEVRATATMPNIQLRATVMGMGWTTGHIGPELGMANALSEYYTAENPAVIFKFGVGGTYLGDWEGASSNTQTFGGWASPSLLKEWNEKNYKVHEYAGKLYERLIEVVTSGVQTLRAQGYAPSIKGYAWMQGESDTEAAKWGNVYGHNLELFINDLREDVAKISGDEDAVNRPFTIGKIAPDFANHGQPYIDTVRAAQDEVAAKLPYVYTVETDDLRIGGGNGSDDWHFNAADAYTLGRRFATTAHSNLAKYSYAVSIGQGGTVTSTNILSNGEAFTVGYELLRGKVLDKVFLNGEDVTSAVVQGGVITITPTDETLAFNTIEITLKNAVSHKFSLTLGANGRVVSRSPSGSTVYEGETVVLTLAPDEGYEVEAVTANGTAVPAGEDGKYHIVIGTQDCAVNITFRPVQAGTLPPQEDGDKGGGGCRGALEIGPVCGGAAVLAGAGLAVGIARRKKKK